jgi:hypothetical protein
MKPNLLVVSIMLVWAAPAFADILPPEDTLVTACNGRSAGQACSASGTGTCQNATCAKDYAHRDDAGQPGASQAACVKCVVEKSNLNTHVGCSEGVTGREFGALAIAGSFSLLLLLKRRRSRS